jgi:hypothetical protein
MRSPGMQTAKAGLTTTSRENGKIDSAPVITSAPIAARE